MSRCVLLLALCLAAVDTAIAEEQVPVQEPHRVAESSASAASAKSEAHPKPAVANSSSLSGRRKLETLLQQPAKLEFGGRKHVSVKEVLDQLRERHPLSIRFDIPTLAGIYGVEALYSGSETRAKPKSEPKAESKSDSKSDSKADSKVDSKPEPKAASKADDESDAASESPTALGALLNFAMEIESLDLKAVSIGTVLRHALDSVPMVIEGSEEFSGLPIPITNAMLLDYLVEDDGLLITTRMKALTSKETRVYTVKQIKDCPPEQLAKLIRQSIRPWSWRSQINDLGDQLKGTSLPPEMLKSVLQTGAQLASSQTGMTVTVADAPKKAETGKGDGTSVETSTKDEAKEMAMLGNALANGLITLAQATLSALEMVHYGEPPTGVIQPFGSKLVITQSQAAHREIADLLKQLAEE